MLKRSSRTIIEIPFYSAEEYVYNIKIMDMSLFKVKTFLCKEANLIEIRPREILYTSGNDGIDYSLRQAIMMIVDRRIHIVSI
jgi:hypothetical protein